jgi:hypothetical protein
MRLVIFLTALSLGFSIFSPGICQTSNADRDVGIYMTGEELTSHCRAFLLRIKQGNRATAQQASDSGLCYGFTVGVLDSISLEGLVVSPAGAPRMCLPKGFNGNTAAEIVGKFLDAHPEQRALAGYGLVRGALAEAFPCH